MTDSVGQHMPQKNSCQKQKKNNGLEITMVNTDQGQEVKGTPDEEGEDVRQSTMKKEFPEVTGERVKRRKKCTSMVKVEPIQSNMEIRV